MEQKKVTPALPCPNSSPTESVSKNKGCLMPLSLGVVYYSAMVASAGDIPFSLTEERDVACHNIIHG